MVIAKLQRTYTAWEPQISLEMELRPSLAVELNVLERLPSELW